MGALADVQPEALAGTVPLPFGLLPTAVALQVVALEYGFHRNDLAWALGRHAARYPAGPAPDARRGQPGLRRRRQTGVLRGAR